MASPPTIDDLKQRASDFFDGWHARDVQLPNEEEYARAFYERYRGDWSDDPSFSSQAWNDFIYRGPQDERERKKLVWRRERADESFDWWDGFLKTGVSAEESVGPETPLADASQWEALAEGGGPLLYHCLEQSKAKSRRAKALAASLLGGRPLVFGALQWWGRHGGPILIGELVDYIRHRYWSALRERERVIHEQATASIRVRAQVAVRDQVRDHGAILEWSEYKKRKGLYASESGGIERVILGIPPILIDDLGGPSALLNPASRHRPFSGWILKLYDLLRILYTQQDRRAPAKDAREEVCRRHEEAHGYIIRRLTNRRQDGTISPETVRHYLRKS